AAGRTAPTHAAGLPPASRRHVLKRLATKSRPLAGAFVYCRSAAASKSSSLCSPRTSASVLGGGGGPTADELRAVLRSTVSPWPAAAASIPSPPSFPSIPT